MSRPPHPIGLNNFNYTSSLFVTNILLSALFSNALSLLSFFDVRDQVSHPYRTTGKIMGCLSKLGQHQSLSFDKSVATVSVAAVWTHQAGGTDLCTYRGSALDTSVQWHRPLHFPPPSLAVRLVPLFAYIFFSPLSLQPLSP
jgi:hypothetical protein